MGYYIYTKRLNCSKFSFVCTIFERSLERLRESTAIDHLTVDYILMITFDEETE